MVTMQQAVTASAGIALERQLYLSDVITDIDQFDYAMDTGKLTFGNQLSLSAEILGTEAHGSGTWLWAWANTASNIPENLLRLANRLRQYGQDKDFAVLTQPEVNLDELHNGHHFAMVASKLLNLDAYYRIPYDGGALFVLINDPAYPPDPRDPLQRIAFTFPQVIANVKLTNHHSALRAYLKAHNISVITNEPTKLEATGANDQTIVVTFDDNGRMTNLNVKMKSDMK